MSRLRAPLRELIDASLDDARAQRMWRGLSDVPRRPRRAGWVAVGALALCAAAILGVLRFREAGALAADGGGAISFDRPRVVLRDGSQIVVSEHARLEVVENTGRAFGLRLHGGRVHLEVTPGGPRRWRVECGDVEVVVVGTGFAVDRQESALRVEVDHGVVEVRGARVSGGVRRLTAGEVFEVDAAGLQPTAAGPPATARWEAAAAVGGGALGVRASADASVAATSGVDAGARRREVREVAADGRVPARVGRASRLRSSDTEGPSGDNATSAGPAAASGVGEASPRADGDDRRAGAGEARVAAAPSVVLPHAADGGGFARVAVGGRGADPVGQSGEERRAGASEARASAAVAEKAPAPAPTASEASVTARVPLRAADEPRVAELASINNAPAAESGGPANGDLQPLAADARALLNEADRARRAGQPARALSLLRRVMRAWPESTEAAIAGFTAARLLMDARPEEAAAALRVSLAAGAPDSLREDVLARLVEAYARASKRELARRAAADYRHRYPRGRRAAEVERWAH